MEGLKHSNDQAHSDIKQIRNEIAKMSRTIVEFTGILERNIYDNFTKLIERNNESNIQRIEDIKKRFVDITLENGRYHLEAMKTCNAQKQATERMLEEKQKMDIYFESYKVDLEKHKKKFKKVEESQLHITEALKVINFHLNNYKL